MEYNSDVPDPNKHEQTPDVVRESLWCLLDSCQHIVDWRERHRHSHACTHADTHPHTCMYTDTWHLRTHTHTQTHAPTRKYTHTHADSHTYTRTQTHANKRARTHTHTRTPSHDTHAHTRMHEHAHVTRTQGRTPPRVFEPGKGADSGGWAEERETRNMWYSESISGHTVITTTENNRKRCIAIACAMSLLCACHMYICGSLVLWTSFVLNGMFILPCTMNRVGHAQGVCMWITRSNDVANVCKQNARGIGKAQAGKCQAWASKGHAQVGAWCAQARKHTAHKGYC